MNNLLQAIINPAFPFLRNALLAGILSSAAFGVIGTFVVVRRISSIAGAISHSVLGGVGLALFCQARFGWMWFHPMIGAFLAALLSALIIAEVQGKQREDTVINAIWAVGMASGLLFLAKTPGYVDPMSYLFGNILIVSNQDLLFILILDMAVLLTAILLFNGLQASSFDEEFTAVRGLNPRGYHRILLLMTALTVVLMTSIVGIVMVIALLTLPAAISNQFFKRLIPMMFLTGGLTMLLNAGGISLSYLTDLPSGPVIILLAAVLFLLSILFRKVLKLILSKNDQTVVTL